MLSVHYSDITLLIQLLEQDFVQNIFEKVLSEKAGRSYNWHIEFQVIIIFKDRLLILLMPKIPVTRQVARRRWRRM